MSSVALMPPAAPADPALSTDIPCLRCGYNLRTLPLDAKCPECSAPVSASLDSNLLRYSDPAWTSVLALATGIMFAAIAIQLPFVVSFSVLDDWIWRKDLAALLAGRFMPALYFADSLFWLGVFLLGYPDRSGADWRCRFSLRRTLRGTALVALVFTLPSSWQFSELPVSEFLKVAAMMIMFLYLMGIAGRSGNSPLLWHTRIVGIAFILASIFQICLGIFWEMPWVDSIEGYANWLWIPLYSYLLYLLYRVRRSLLSSATLARRHWSFCSPLVSAPA